MKLSECRKAEIIMPFLNREGRIPIFRVKNKNSIIYSISR